jgi:hypothetical protein
MYKTFVTLMIGAMSVTLASAGILGVLVDQHSTTSVTGRLVWVCTYSVAGSETTVVLNRMCPPSMQFQ